MLYFDFQLDLVRLTKHLRGTRESEQKKKCFLVVLFFVPLLFLL